MQHPEIHIRPIETIRPHPKNSRTHPKKQVRQIANSVVRIGWTVPIIVDESGVILAGVGRYLAAILLGLKEVPVIVVSGLSDAARRAYILADNKIAANAGWDRQLLSTELAELTLLLPDLNLDISITGFETVEIDNLQHDLVDTEITPSDEVPPPALKAITRPGDLWALGDHRVLCGDARDDAAMQLLMQLAKASMVFTDPPYNVRVKDVQGRGKTKHREFAAASGEMSKAEFTSFLAMSLGNAAAYSRDGAIHFVCMDWRHFVELQIAGEKVYTDIKNVVVWNKTNAGQGSFYRSQHELIFVFKVGTAAHTNNFELGQKGRYRSNVWTYPGANTFRAGRMNDLAMHPTVKPVALVADAIRDCSHRGDIILDPFMGSGTTIIAAERIGRRGYGLELDPLYVDVIVRRWQALNKRDAILGATGQTFDDVNLARRSSEAAL